LKARPILQAQVLGPGIPPLIGAHCTNLIVPMQWNLVCAEG
jgi:hypothetical protein